MRDTDAADIIDMSQIVAGPDRGKVSRSQMERLIDRFPADRQAGMREECERYMSKTKREFWEGGHE